MKILKEFKEFAVKGNMIDMAVGIIIGTAFNKVISTLVAEVILPPLSLMASGISYADRKMVLKEAELDQTGKEIAKEISIGYGAFFEVFLDFLIVGFTLFIVIKLMNRLRNKSQNPEDKTVATPKDIELLTDLNTLMKEQNKILSKNLKK